MASVLLAIYIWPAGNLSRQILLRNRIMTKVWNTTTPIRPAVHAEKPRTFAEISAMLSGLMPDCDVGSMRYTVRMHVPLVQVSVRGGWSCPGNSRFTLAESWLGRPVLDEEDSRTLVFRYLAALGPVSVAARQTWCGMPKLKDGVEALRPDLVVFHDEKKRELLDVPGAPRDDAGTPVAGGCDLPGGRLCARHLED